MFRALEDPDLGPADGDFIPDTPSPPELREFLESAGWSKVIVVNLRSASVAAAAASYTTAATARRELGRIEEPGRQCRVLESRRGLEARLRLDRDVLGLPPCHEEIGLPVWCGIVEWQVRHGGGTLLRALVGLADSREGSWVDGCLVLGPQRTAAAVDPIEFRAGDIAPLSWADLERRARQDPEGLRALLETSLQTSGGERGRAVIAAAARKLGFEV
jgi:hypothetical protein